MGLFKRKPKGPKKVYRIYKTTCPHCGHIKFGIIRPSQPKNCKKCDKVICNGHIVFVGSLEATSTVEAIEKAKGKYQ